VQEVLPAVQLDISVRVKRELLLGLVLFVRNVKHYLLDWFVQWRSSIGALTVSGVWLWWVVAVVAVVVVGACMCV
jgi:hypothetical protein